MRWLVALVLALAVIWSGYWFVGARVIEAQADRQFAGAEARGVVAEREALAVRGFPNRFDLTVDGPRLLDPASGYGWEAPFLQIFALTWQPWHVIVAFPPDQVFTTPFGPARLTAAKMQASIRARPRASLPLEQLTLVGEGLGLTFAPLGPVSARELRFASRDRDGTGMTQEVGLEVLDLSPDPALLARLGDVPDLIERLRVDADLRFDRPIDRFAFPTRPALTSLRLHEAVLDWGAVSARAEGMLTPDAAGRAEGSLDLRLANWRQLLPMAVSAGVVRAETAGTLERVLGILALQSGNPDTIQATLTFGGGVVSLGPMTLGPAPMLR